MKVIATKERLFFAFTTIKVDNSNIA